MEKERTAPEMTEGWSKDEFPTSAKPVFRRAGLLVLAIIVLCAFVYSISEHPEDIEKEKRKEELQRDWFE